MKHLFNDLSSEEKNRILEQHSGGKKILNENFNKLISHKLGDAKPLISEQTPVSGRTQPQSLGVQQVSEEQLDMIKSVYKNRGFDEQPKEGYSFYATTSKTDENNNMIEYIIKIEDDNCTLIIQRNVLKHKDTQNPPNYYEIERNEKTNEYNIDAIKIGLCPVIYKETIYKLMGSINKGEFQRLGSFSSFDQILEYIDRDNLGFDFD